MSKLIKFVPIEVKKIIVDREIVKKIFVRFKTTFSVWKEVNLYKEHEKDFDDFIHQLNHSFQKRYNKIENEIKEYNKDLRTLRDTIELIGKDEYSPSMRRYFKNRLYLTEEKGEKK